MWPRERNPRVERVEFELRATGVKAGAANPLRSGVHTRGYLPHVKREGGRYFVVFRLVDSLPRDVLLKLASERAERLARVYAQAESPGNLAKAGPQTEALAQIDRDYFRKLEEYLDKGKGECYLKRPEIAELVATAMRFFDGERYQLKAWVVMPNHVHAVLWPMPNHTLSKILQGWKGYTAREANKLLGRTGKTFWQPESFDHWIRNDAEYARCCDYVELNPVKAGLCETPADRRWSSAWQRANR